MKFVIQGHYVRWVMQSMRFRTLLLIGCQVRYLFMFSFFESILRLFFQLNRFCFVWFFISLLLSSAIMSQLLPLRNSKVETIKPLDKLTVWFVKLSKAIEIDFHPTERCNICFSSIGKILERSIAFCLRKYIFFFEKSKANPFVSHC